MNAQTILVFGATGRMGGAAARHLYASGWKVRAVTRNPGSDAAQRLRTSGMEVVQGDLGDPESLRPAFKDIYGVFLVVNWQEAGFDVEIQYGKNVADLAVETGIKHLVFVAAGTGQRGTGIRHFETKLDIEAYMNQRQVPLTMILPPPFMELMTDPALYPQVGMWHAKMKLLGEGYKMPWIATDDIGGLAAVIFARPEHYTGRRVAPVGEWKTLGECRRLYEEISGKAPPRWPLPIWLLRRMQPELIAMWEWLARTDLSDLELLPVGSIYRGATNIRSFLQHELVSAS